MRLSGSLAKSIRSSKKARKNMRKLLSIILILFLPLQAFATLPVTAVWEINTSATANNVNGGGFNPSRTMTNNDLACTNANTATVSCTSAGDAFIAGDNGNYLFVQSGGTYTANIFCPITGFSAGTITVNATAGACNVLSTAVQGGWTTNSSNGIASTASPTGGVWGIDLSRTTAANQTSTTAAYTTGTFLLSAGGLTYRPAYIGNILQLTAGTNCTQKWYEITAAVLSTSYTLDSEAGATCAANVSISIGGAIKLGSATANRTDDAFFEQATGTNGTGAMTFFVKAGNYSPTSIIVTTGACGTQAQCEITGYGTIRGDTPTGTGRPVFAAGASSSTTFNSNMNVSNLVITTSVTAGLTLGANSKATNVKVANSSTTTTAVAFTLGADGQVLNSEGISYRGRGVASGSNPVTIYGSYFHDSDICTLSTGTGITAVISNTIYSGCVTGAVQFTGALINRVTLTGNTFYGAENKLGVGVDFASGVTDSTVGNNIFYGLSSGITHAGTQTSGSDFNNDFSNNTTNANANWHLASTSITTAPAFTNATQLTGTGAVILSSNRIQDTTKNFTSLGVVANATPGVGYTDYVNYTSGTGAGTKGIYAITAITTVTNPNDTITVDLTLTADATTDHAYQIGLGHNYLPTASLPGFPGAFPASLTTGNLTIGAAQKAATTIGGGGIIGQ